MVRLSILIDEHDKHELSQQAEALGLSFSSYVRMILHTSAKSKPVLKAGGQRHEDMD